MCLCMFLPCNVPAGSALSILLLSVVNICVGILFCCARPIIIYPVVVCACLCIRSVIMIIIYTINVV